MGEENAKIETTSQVKQDDVPMNNIKDSEQKVKKWLKTVSPKEEETDEEKENDISKHLLGKERLVDFSQSVLSKSAMMTSFPKLNLPVFDGDPCAWPNWYGMFKALVHDQQLSKTQKMIYLKASVKGTAEKAIAGMFFDGTMYEKAIAERTQRFGNPAFISKSLINKFLAIPVVQDENKSSLRLFVDNLHTIVRTLKTYDHEADLRAAANMLQIVRKLPPKIAVRWSRRKLELQPKEVGLNDLDEWLGTEVQVQEMAFGLASTKENSAQGKPEANSNKPKWFKKEKDV